jgi:uncharacterized protein YfaS (alpha-2-macroglobulin family)
LEGFSPGQKYTLFLDSRLKSAAGDAFARPQSWEIQVLDAPRVIERSPAGGQLRVRRPPIRLRFDREMDPQSAARALNVRPELPLDVEWNDGALAIHLQQPLVPGVRYRFTLDKTATGIDGIPLGEAVRWEYWLDPFQISLNNAVDYAINKRSVSLSFNYPIDTAKTGLPFALEPAVNGYWKWDGKNRVFFIADENFPIDRLYRIHFTGPIYDQYGDRLPLPEKPVVFGSESPVKRTSPQAIKPTNFSDPVRVEFNQPMDRSRTEEAFRISPELKGRFEWEGHTLLFIPEEDWLPYREYSLSIGVTALNAAGQAVLVRPYTWTIHTNYASYGSQPVSFGEYGANIQVVDAEGRRAIQFGLQTDSPKTVRLDLYQLDLGSFVQQYAQDFKISYSWDNANIDVSGREVYKTWQTTYDSNGIQELILPGDVPPGLYVLNLSAGVGQADQIFLVLTRHTLVVKHNGDELLAWVSDINGASAPEVEVRLYSDRGEKIRVGKTDSGGLYRTTIPLEYTPLLVAARGEGEDVSIVGLGSAWNSDCSFCWWWGGSARQNTPKHTVYLVTDRPIYRPGQRVYFKGIVRADRDVKYSLPPEGLPVTLRIRDARNNLVQTFELAANEFGTFNGEFHLAEGAMLGDYFLEAVLEGDTSTQKFKVQDYRKPDFRVSVQPSAEIYVEGDQMDVRIDVRYLMDRPVSNARLTIQLYNLAAMYTSWWDETSQQEPEYTWYAAGEARTQTTDSQGQATYTQKVALAREYQTRTEWSSSLEYSAWGMEVTADDGSGQVVSGFAVYKVYNAAEKISLDTGGYLKRPGEPFTIQAEARTINGEGVPGRQLSLELRRWNERSWDYTPIVSNTQTAITGAGGQASLPYIVQEPGYYQLRLSGKDDRGASLKVERWIYVFDKNDAWANRAADEIKITAERDSYRPYETARFVIESSFSGPALLAFERGRVNRVKQIELTAPLTLVDAEIIPEDSPNIFVTASAWQPQDTRLGVREEGYAYMTSLPDSRLRTGSVELRVESSAQALEVTIASDKESYTPRQTATFTVTVTNRDGLPVAAEVSLAMVDESIYSLSEDLSRPIFEAFYGRRNNAIQTFDSLAPVREIMAGGRGGGGGGISQGNPRSAFPDTAAWFPSIRTGEDGQASVTLAMPDSLTGWRLTARAVTQSTQVGETTLNIVTQQELVIRPLLPGSPVAGDTFELPTMAHNYAAVPVTVTLTLEAERLRLEAPPTQTLALQPGEMRIAAWPVTAAEAGAGQVTITGITDAGGADAVRLPLNIHPLAIPDVYTQAGDFSGAWSTTLVVPETALISSTIQVRLSRSPAGSVLQGLEYLTGYPYGCVEQTMSRALPNAVVGRALTHLGIEDPALQASLPELINAGLQKLYGFQHDDGGWGWWFDDASHDYQTAWVLYGLSVTAEAGYAVDPEVIERGAGYLSRRLSEMDLRTRAYALYSLAVAGHGNIEHTLALVEQAIELDPFSQAALALTLDMLGESARAASTLELLSAAAEVETQEGNVKLVSWPGVLDDGYYAYKTMSSTTRSTALVLAAYTRLAPDHPLIPGIVRYLMSKRRAQGWGSTNETAYTILALTDHLLAVNEAAPETGYQIELNGQAWITGTLGHVTPSANLRLPVDRMQRGANLFKITQAGEGRLYYVINSRILLPVTAIQPAGPVEVRREYLDARARSPVTEFVPGQLVRVRLTVRLAQNAPFFIVEDQLPAGLEALNERLNTTSHDPAGYDTGYGTPRLFWEQYGYNYKEIRGARVSFFITELQKSTFTLTYLARVARTGTFTALPAEAYAMYDETLWGRSSSTGITIGFEPDEPIIQKEFAPPGSVPSGKNLEIE